MLTKLNRNNTNFQIAYFIAGSCHTPDAAYIALVSQRQDRERALAQVEVGKIREQIQRLQAERLIASPDPIEQLEGQANLLQLEIDLANQQTLIEAAEAELDFINQCIEKIQPLRKYAHLSDAEALEASQAEEWAHELRYRAENFLLTQGTIPSDHFATMRQHPAFETYLLPGIERIHKQLQSPTGARPVLTNSRRLFDLPQLMGLDPAVPSLEADNGQSSS